MKTKEEKEVLEHFAGVVSGCVHLLRLAHYKSVTALSLPLSQFTMMSMSMFKEIFTELIDYLVERIQSNYALQIIPNSTTSPTFASILLNFLLKVHTACHIYVHVHVHACTIQPAKHACAHAKLYMYCMNILYSWKVLSSTPPALVGNIFFPTKFLCLVIDKNEDEYLLVEPDWLM